MIIIENDFNYVWELLHDQKERRKGGGEKEKRGKCLDLCAIKKGNSGFICFVSLIIEKEAA